MSENTDGHVSSDGKFPLTRRHALEAGTALAVLGHGRIALAEPVSPIVASPSDTPMMTIALIVNGSRREITIDTRTSLLDALREHLGLAGSKKGCDHGQCGACTVLLEGRRINACLSLAVMHDGERITTIEGLGNPDQLHPLQAAFIHRDAYQCGYCTPGQICSAAGMLAEHKAGWPSVVTEELTANPGLTEAEIRERMSGNICRCSAYPNIVAAIRDTAGDAS